MSLPHIENIAAIDIRLRPKVWDFTTDHAAEIEDYWQMRLLANPHLYNGNVLLAANVIRDATPAGDHASLSAPRTRCGSGMIAVPLFGFVDQA